MLERAAPPVPDSADHFLADVFVTRKFPWASFLQSSALHAIALAAMWGTGRLVALQPQVSPQPVFAHSTVIYYTPSEYLPPLDTRRESSASVRRADPEVASQALISVPQEADNRSQTIVAPPAVRLQRAVALPNMVALSKWDDPRMPIGPAPVVNASQISRLAPRVENAVVAPPPRLESAQREMPNAPQAAIIAPPPEATQSSTRRLGDLNVARSAVIAPAPQLTVDEQRAFSGRSSATAKASTSVVAPPPSLLSAGGSRSGGNVIALSLHPAVTAPPDPPAGNRRGEFASTPSGRHGASGAAGASAGDSSANGKSNETSPGTKSASSLPSGLYVGAPAKPASPASGDPASGSGRNSVNPNLLANARPPRLSSRALQPEASTRLSEEERAVFGNRKFYSLSLNMPNLNSAGGSWVVRFAALKAESGPAGLRGNSNPSSDDPAGLSAPSAIRKVDPAYPLEMMRQHVGGTVILYAVIHADGSVGSVRVLRSIDDRLDQFASEAIAKWKFDPATKNGVPVEVEATFWIPFQPARVGANF